MTPRPSWRAWAWPTGPGRRGAPCRAASSSACRWRWPSWAGRRWPSWTSPPPAAPPGLDVAALGAHLGAAVREVGTGEYAVDAAPSPATVARLTAWLAERDLALGDLRAGRARLGDVFLRLTGEERR